MGRFMGPQANKSLGQRVDVDRLSELLKEINRKTPGLKPGNQNRIEGATAPRRNGTERK